MLQLLQHIMLLRKNLLRNCFLRLIVCVAAILRHLRNGDKLRE